MRDFKIQFFEEDNPGKKFPSFRVASKEDSVAHKTRISHFIKSIMDDDPVADFDANKSEFSLSEVWNRVNVAPQDNLLLEFDGELVTEMRRVDVEQFLSDIWYPTSDDLFIFDSSAEWLLLVHHSGLIFVSK